MCLFSKRGFFVLSQFEGVVMTALEALDFVNVGPYVFRRFLGNGIVFSFGNNGNKIDVSKNKKRGGIDVACGDKVFNFQWDSENKKWSAG